MLPRLGGALASLAIAVVTAVAIVALAILPFLNPVWVGFEQERAGSSALTGLPPGDLRIATGGILHDLVLGPPRFDVTIRGTPVLEEREREHMRDVRRVFGGFFALGGAAVVVLVATILFTRGASRARVWRAISRGGWGTAVVTVVAGVVAIPLFDTAFELFHEAFFPPGTYLFDPTTDRLVQLFPEPFWVETTLAVGVVVVVLGLVVGWLAVLRSRRAVHTADHLGARAGSVARATR